MNHLRKKIMILILLFFSSLWNWKEVCSKNSTTIICSKCHVVMYVKDFTSFPYFSSSWSKPWKNTDGEKVRIRTLKNDWIFFFFWTSCFGHDPKNAKGGFVWQGRLAYSLAMDFFSQFWNYLLKVILEDLFSWTYIRLNENEQFITIWDVFRDYI